MNPLLFLATLQILCCLLTGWAAMRVMKAIGLGPWMSLTACGAWAALGACGHDSSMAFLKGYVTPASVAGTALVWGMAFYFEKRTVPSLLALFLAASSHLGFAPLALVMASTRMYLDSRANAPMKISFPLFILLAIGLSTLGLESWEAFSLERNRFRSNPESFDALMGTLSGYKFMGELALLGLLAVRRPLSHECLPSSLFLLTLLGLLIPGAWPFLRATPLVELLTLGALLKLCPRVFIQPLFSTVTILIILLWQGVSGRLHSLDGISLGPRPLVASQPMMDFIRKQTQASATFVIPPHFTTFRSHAARRPYVDIAATPWTQTEREFWNKRLRDIYGPGSMNHVNLYATPWQAILERAWKTGAEYLLWPSTCVPPDASKGAIVQQDGIWTLVDLAKVTR